MSYLENVLANFFENLVMRCFHVSVASIRIPKNFT